MNIYQDKAHTFNQFTYLYLLSPTSSASSYLCASPVSIHRNCKGPYLASSLTLEEVCIVGVISVEVCMVGLTVNLIGSRIT